MQYGYFLTAVFFIAEFCMMRMIINGLNCPGGSTTKKLYLYGCLFNPSEISLLITM